jgi:tRNA (guanine37-N1)-methyltransferase
VNVEILPAGPADAGELLTVQLAAYLSEGRLHDTFDIPPLLETLAEVRAAIEQERVLKAVAGTRLVGSVRGRVVDGATGYIGRLAVAPDWQGRGIGTRLIAGIEAELTGPASPVRQFELMTGVRSEPNIRLYERLGYLRVPSPDDTRPYLLYLRKAAGPMASTMDR